MRNCRKNKGFTLVEVIITLTILAVLTAIFVPSFIAMSNNARVEKDVAVFESISIAFKKSLSEPEVRKEVEQLGLGQKKTIAFKISEDGVINFNEGTIMGTSRTPLQTSTLWLNTYQSVGTSCELESQDFDDKYLICELVPKTEKTTAQCHYKIENKIIYGDLDGSGDITQEDIDILRNYLNELDAGLNNWQLSLSDLNGDGIINHDDLSLLRNCFNTGTEILP